MDGVIFYSHINPSVELVGHLKEVSNRMSFIYNSQKHYLKIPIDEDFIKIIGLAHDFGKYTSFFQRHLLEGMQDTKKRHHHSFISALFGAWLSDSDNYHPLIAYFVIRHHHGDLKNLDDDLDDFKNRENLSILKEQVEDIKKYRKIIEREYGFEIGDFLDRSEDVWEKLKEENFKLIENETQEERIKIYFIILYLYSLLIDSDKKSAAHIKELKRERLSLDILEKYRKFKNWNKPKRAIDRLRNKLYIELKNNLSSLKKGDIPSVSTITAPTGLGKTYLNFLAALRYRDLQEDFPKIIYVLPFVSIIDQTYKIFDDIFSQTLKEKYIKDKDRYLLKHHHLTPVKYKAKGEERPVSEALLLIESWDSEVVVTTFVQFLHSVIAFKNSFLKKFHNIVGAVIILDEIQSLNIELWQVSSFILRKLTEYFSCKIILSTATEPKFMENARELVKNVDFYFRTDELKRTKLVPKIRKKKTLRDFIRYFLDNIDKNIRSYLIVLNTIKSSIEFYEGIQELSSIYKIFYLSTNIVPFQRKIRIFRIRNALEKGEKIILVSTQVVEAGVDLDFQKVYRDIAPLDSIIQVAGRCNRNKKTSISSVEIHSLIDENSGRAFSKMVYGSTLVSISEDVLEHQIEEPKYRELIDKYFQKVKENKSFEKSEIILKDIDRLCFSGEENCIARDFKVIEELPFYEDIFVEVNKTAQRIYSNFEKKVLKERNFIKRLENYQILKSKFKDYIISVPVKFISSAQNIDTFPKIPLENLEEFYDKDGYGLKRTRIDDALIW